MANRLFLRQRTKEEKIMETVPKPANRIPINALPGWEDLQLFCKLPMLKCPDKQIIFSRGKIGEKLWKEGEFRLDDTMGNDNRIEYDSLHDPHLKKYFKQENNRKHLRQIGRLTANNDVICTLKDFNSYRMILQHYYMDLVRKEFSKREEEQSDRTNVYHAENIAEKERENLPFTYKSENDQGKISLDHIKRQIGIKSVEKWRRIVERFEKLRDSKKQELSEKSKKMDILIQQKREFAADMENMRIIALKKKFAARDVQFAMYKWQLTKDKLEASKLRDHLFWEKRIRKRIKHNQRNAKILTKAEKRRLKNIEEIKKAYRRKWLLIDKSTRKETKAKRTEIQVPKHCYKIESQNSEDETSRDSSSEEIEQDALHEKEEAQNRNTVFVKRKNINAYANVVYLLKEGGVANEQLLDVPDAVVKIAKNIRDKVINNFNTDLSKNEVTLGILTARILNLFDRIKKEEFEKVISVIQYTATDKAFFEDQLKDSSLILKLPSTKTQPPKLVSFGQATNIGKTVEQLQSSVELKRSRSRVPTPKMSLDSLVAVKVDGNEEQLLDNREYDSRKSLFSHCSEAERIFIEYFYIIFKKKLILAVNLRVFTAMRCFQNSKIYNVRRQLLDVDQNYLAEEMARSILAYAVNANDFHSALWFCTNVLSSNIINELQKSILKPKRDPRVLNKPHCRCPMYCPGFRI